MSMKTLLSGYRMITTNSYPPPTTLMLKNQLQAGRVDDDESETVFRS